MAATGSRKVLASKNVQLSVWKSLLQVFFVRIGVAVLSIVGHTSRLTLLNVVLLLLGLVQMTVRLRAVKHDHIVPG